MKCSRRRFAVECTVLAATAFLPPSVLGFSVVSGDLPPHELDLATFTKHLNTVFHVRASEGASVKLKLVQTQSLPWRSGGSNGRAPVTGESFSLTFRGSSGTALPQGTYAFEHAALGRFSIFIAPAGYLAGEARSYQAVFNRIAPSARSAA